MQGWAEQAG